MRLLIAIVDAGLSFNGKDLSHQVLGGAESAVYFMARELARIGHDLHVICRTEEPGTYDRVVYHSIDTWPHLSATNDWDVLISNRNASFLTGRLKSRFNVVWTHEFPAEEYFDMFMKYAWSTDAMFVMSDFQARAWTRERPGLPSGWLNPLLYVTRNGIDLRMIQQSIKNVRREKKRLLYGSRPERGLQWLLEMWPAFLEKDPELELRLCSYTVTQDLLSDQVRELYKLCDQMVEGLENVTNLGGLTKQELYAELASCRAVVYPCHFPEISCILAMEAMACGTPVITTKDFALPETIGNAGVLLEGRPRDESYRQQFQEKTLELTRDDVLWKDLSNRGKAQAKLFDWCFVAQEWNEYFHRYFEERFNLNRKYIVQQMIYESDLVAARRLAQETPDLCHQELTQLETWLKNAEDPELFERYAQKGENTDYEQALTVWRQAGRFAMVAEEVPEDAQRLLDVGCNVGMLFAHVAEKYPNIEMTGIDTSQRLIDQARMFVIKTVERVGNVKLHCVNIKDFHDEEGFDVVTCCETLEHLIDTRWMIGHLERLCRPGGRIILTLPYGPWEAQSYWELQKPTVREHVHHFGSQEIQQLFGNKKRFNVTFAPVSGVAKRGEILGNWILSWTCAPSRDLGEIDWEWKKKTTRPYQKISGALIVKNEEDWILGSLKSAADVVDEIVLFINDSTDMTRDLIEKYASTRAAPIFKVIDGKWDPEEGFAAARNKALAACDPESDWHLWWDADERLVNGHMLHRFTHTPLYPGYIIPQNHLILDMKADPDSPVRFFRTAAGAKFVGVIHEHPEREMNQPLEPMLTMPDVQFAHYGYLTERIRREKCVMRNIPLLLKDREKNPKRLVGLIFLQRDYIHCAEWHMHARKKVTPEALKFLRAVVDIYHDVFSKLEDNLYRRRWWSYSFAFYQTALRYLGSATESISTTEGDRVPFQVASVLSGGYGGLSDEGEFLKPEKRWFCSQEEFMTWNQQQGERFSKIMQVRRVGELLEDAQWR